MALIHVERKTMREKITTILVLLGMMASVANVWASDAAKEQRWLDQVADSILDGDVEMLTLGDKEIFSIYTEADENPKKRAMIVVHGLGVHPNWAQVVQPVRVEMTQYGWHTLSIQMPILENGVDGTAYLALFDEVAPRIEAAIKFLKSNDIQEIVLVSHSMGSAMSAYYFSQNPNSVVSKFVAIGLGGANAIKNIHVPMLDLYGSEDLPNVLQTAVARKNAAKKAKNEQYKQVVVTGASHFFDGKNAELIDALNAWLK